MPELNILKLTDIIRIVTWMFYSKIDEDMRLNWPTSTYSHNIYSTSWSNTIQRIHWITVPLIYVIHDIYLIMMNITENTMPNCSASHICKLKYIQFTINGYAHTWWPPSPLLLHLQLRNPPMEVTLQAGRWLYNVIQGHSAHYSSNLAPASLNCSASPVLIIHHL